VADTRRQKQLIGAIPENLTRGWTQRGLGVDCEPGHQLLGWPSLDFWRYPLSESCSFSGIYPPDVGGPATYIPKLAEYLAKQGHLVTVFSLTDKKTKELQF
jgi:hypothetical protein